MYLIAWLNARPYCWAASIDGGKTWHKLQADDDEYTPDAIDEAAKRFGIATDKWGIQEEPVISAQ